MPATYNTIATTTLSAGTATVTFSAITSAYTDLVIVMNVAATAASSTGFGMYFNSDTGTNYSDTRINGDGTTATSARGATQARILQFSASLPEAASTYSPVITQVFNYSNTTTCKTSLTRSNNSANAIQAIAGVWRATPVAITSITFYTFAGTFATGSTFTLYGIKAA
jgi:hypothetical protein